MFRQWKPTLREAGSQTSRRRKHRFVPSLSGSLSRLEDRVVLSGATHAAAVAHKAAVLEGTHAGQMVNSMYETIFGIKPSDALLVSGVREVRSGHAKALRNHLLKEARSGDPPAGTPVNTGGATAALASGMAGGVTSIGGTTATGTGLAGTAGVQGSTGVGGSRNLSSVTTPTAFSVTPITSAAAIPTFTTGTLGTTSSFSIGSNTPAPTTITLTPVFSTATNGTRNLSIVATGNFGFGSITLGNGTTSTTTGTTSTTTSSGVTTTTLGSLLSSLGLSNLGSSGTSLASMLSSSNPTAAQFASLLLSALTQTGTGTTTGTGLTSASSLTPSVLTFSQLPLGQIPLSVVPFVHSTFNPSPIGQVLSGGLIINSPINASPIGNSIPNFGQTNLNTTFNLSPVASSLLSPTSLI